ncbi:MAG: serine/threonine protein kinase [Myxococcales bacterium]|nr:serine/threonine protein kinase [Myxococcales bacterium]
MAICPSCRRKYPDGVEVCAKDGEALLPDQAFVAEDAELAPGRMVGEYRIERRLGQGGFGTVYAAVHPVIGKTAAIKVLGRAFSSSPQMVSRFISEARAANKIRSANIIDIFGFGALDDGRHYYIMELCEGLTLEQRLRDFGPLAPPLAVAVLRGVARALDAAHEAGIVHRDLKPDNVFITFDDDGKPAVKLLDFGIAKLLGDDTTVSHKTRTGAPVGTPHYMSPEQVNGLPVDRRSDIYALGVMSFEALTGELPFRGTSLLQLMTQHTFGLGSAGAGLFATVAPPLDSSAPESLLGIRREGTAELVVATDAVALGGALSVASGGSWLTTARTTSADPDLAVALLFDATTGLPAATELAVARPDGIAVSRGLLRLDGVRPAGTLLPWPFVGVVAAWAPALTEGVVPCALAGSGQPDALAFLAVELPAADAVTTRVLVLRPEVLAAIADGTPVGPSDVLGLELPHATEIPVGVGCANVDGTEARELLVVSLTGGMPRQALLRARRLDASGELAQVEGVSDPLAAFDASDLPTLAIPSDTADALPPVAGLAVGDFDGDGVDDVALALGTGIAILHGRAVTP